MATKPKRPLRTLPRSIKAGEFKAKCLALMDQVAATGETVIITKRGEPVARLVPAGSPSRKPRTLVGFLGGTLRSNGDILSPTGEEWDVLKD